MEIGKKKFEVEKHTYIMGILNVTPDSFSDGGTLHNMDDVLFHTRRMMEEGADIIDIGGESTRPGYTQITDCEEIERTAAVIEIVKTEFNLPVSIDTYKAKVAKAAIEAGADMVNDVWGLKYDEKLAGLIAETQTACCLMHNREHAVYKNLMEDIKQDLSESVELAQRAGIARDKLILDPGIGFAKSYENNLEVMARLEELGELGYPLLLGASRKSVIGAALNLPVNQRVEGTVATTVLAVMKHCAFVRVHDIMENKRAIQMTEAMREGWKS